MDRKLAKYIYLLANPANIFVFGLYLLVWQLGVIDLVSYFSFILIVGTPSMITLTVMYFKDKRPPFVFNREVRDTLYLSAIFSSSFASIVFGSVLAHSSFWFNLSLIAVILFCALFVINKYFDRPSFHVCSYAFMTMLLVDQLGTAYALLFSGLPVLFWAIIYNKHHTWIEIMWGWTIGMSVGLLSWLI